MQLTTVLFDLDGTLLPMDQWYFVEQYLKLLAKKMAPHGFDPELLPKAVWAGTEAMYLNDGTRVNEEAFWERFEDFFGPVSRESYELFNEFYANEFQDARQFTGFEPKAREVVELCKALGLRTAVATNPLFPAVATESRIRWAGLEPEDFELYTTYENSRFCKPSEAYYREVTDALGVKPEECLMVGNDTREDMCVEGLGMRTFLLTPHLINRDGLDITRWPHGDYDALLDHVRQAAG